MRIGDIVINIVIIKDEEHLPRNKRQLAIVTETYPSADGYVRSVKLTLAD